MPDGDDCGMQCTVDIKPKEQMTTTTMTMMMISDSMVNPRFWVNLFSFLCWGERE